MTAAADDTSQDPIAERPPAGPGSRLLAARKTAGLNLDKVAAQLHLKPAQVEALEQDRYDDFAARVFVRGYLRNYARLVDLPGDEVLAAFEASCPDPDQQPELRRVGTHKPQVGSGHGVVRLVSWALVLGIVALFLVWWSGYLQLNGSDAAMPAGPSSAETAPAPGELLPQLGQSPVVAAEPEAAPAEAAPQSSEPAVVAPAEPAPVETDVTPESPAASAAKTPVAGETTPDLAPQVVLALSGECWVEIRDQSGTYKLIGKLGPGTREVLGGEPPYRVLLGNASVAEITVDGQPVDLVPHTRGQVARFTLDPNAG